MNRILSEILQPLGLFARPGTGIIQWVDDTCLYAPNVDEYLAALDKFLKKLIEKNLRLNVHKCTFMHNRAHFCGRTISAEGWKHDKAYFDKILLTPKPTFVWQLSQLLFLSNWLSPSVPRLAELKVPFSSLLQQQVPLKTQRKDNTVITWTASLDTAWKTLLRVLNDSSKNFLMQYNED